MIISRPVHSSGGGNLKKNLNGAQENKSRSNKKCIK